MAFKEKVTLKGVLNVYKEKDYTSHDVVAIVRKMFGYVKTGHSGTLDPQAEGVLPVCIGRATKLASYLSAENKSYRAQLLLGISTDTYDHTGQILSSSPAEFNLSEIQKAVDSFVGGYMQEPPMYSAIKIKGKKLYDLARKGINIERKTRRVEISSISISDFDPASNSLWLDVDCGKGTYIRSLCADIGQRLGCGGCMGHLIRTRSGAFSISGAKRLSEIQNKNIDDVIIPVDKAFPAPQGIVTEEYIKSALNGSSIPLGQVVFDEKIPENSYCWLYNNNEVIGLYVLKNDQLRLEVMIHENNKQ